MAPGSHLGPVHPRDLHPHVVDAARRRLAAGDDVGVEHLIDAVIRPTLTGRAITCLAVTEPDGGSDVGALRTTAEPIVDDSGTTTGWRLVGPGLHHLGARADYAVVAAGRSAPARRVALFVVPTDTPGFTVVSRMQKMGWHCSDTAELALTDVTVPAWSLPTPGPGEGFASLARHFAVERISLAVTAYATAARCLDLTLAWTRRRQTFGRPLVGRQVVRHDLVEMYRQIDVARTYTRSVAAGSPMARMTCSAPHARRRPPSRRATSWWTEPCSCTAASASSAMPRWMHYRDAGCWASGAAPPRSTDRRPNCSGY